MHSLFNAAQHHYSSSLRGMSPLEASRVYINDWLSRLPFPAAARAAVQSQAVVSFRYHIWY